MVSGSNEKNLVYFSIVFLCVVFGIVLRFSTFDFFYTNFFGHYNFFDPDSYYHLRRLAFFLQNFPESLSFDPLLLWPVGGQVDWPDLSLWLYGFPLWILGVDSYEGLELGASLLSVFFGLLVCFVLYRAAKNYIPRPYPLVVLFLACLSPLLIRYSCLGQMDHHIFEALLVAFSLCLGARFSNSCYAAAGMGFLFALGFGISSSSLFVLIAFVISVVICFGGLNARKHFLIFSAAFFLVYTAMAAWHFPRWANFFDFKMPSLFQGLAAFSLLLLVSPLFFLKRRRHQAYLFSGLLIFSSFLLLIPEFQSLFKSSFRYVFGRVGILEHVLEANPLFLTFGVWDFDFVWANLGFLAPLATLIPLMLLLYKKLSPSERYLFLMGSILLIPALAQRRFLHFFLPIFLVAIVWMLRKALEFCDQKQIRLKPLLVGAFIFVAVLPSFHYGFSPSMEVMHRVDFSIAKLFKEAGYSEPEEAWTRLASKEAAVGGVWANPNLGHLLTYISGRASLTNPFYSSVGIRSDLEGRRIRSEAAFKEFLDANRIDIVFLLNDFQYFEILHQFAKQSTDYFIDETDRGKTFQLDRLEAFLWYAALLQPDAQLPGMKEVVSAQLMEDYLYNFVRIFERSSTSSD